MMQFAAGLACNTDIVCPGSAKVKTPILRDTSRNRNRNETEMKSSGKASAETAELAEDVNQGCFMK